ncbi:hypothetical protein MKQ70_10400 [Chitinophaga sedimenti]|uniref:hypothetical protein n=1 Tax=Chitinophaga sedimenti TaxID=2033606 RepID=UPI0020061C80|nr:hypothetical protein [Chitinophaga sedimenti]MCK7555392.1 hypothetical protein [Chitinophaga sedimenti]
MAEGKILQRHSASIASESTLTSQLEITLLIVLGMLAIILLLISDQPLIFKEQPPTILN